MITRRLVSNIFFFLIVSLFFNCNIADASTFSLRTFKKGDRLTPFSLPSVIGQKLLGFSPVGDKPTAMVFFSINPLFKQKKSLELIEQIRTLINSEFKNRVHFVKIFSDNQDQGLIKNMITDGLIKSPVFNDKDHKVYNQYGVFMVPVVILCTEKGVLHEVIPATHNIRQIISNNLKLILGDWTVKDFKNSFKLKYSKKWSKEEKEYIRRVNYGSIMFNKKMYSPAAREFSTAAKILPKKPEAKLGLGKVYLKTKKYSKAEKIFNQVLTINPDSDAALSGLGITLYRMGEISRAISILESAMITEKPDIDVVIILAKIYEDKGMMSKALRLNKLALNLLKRRL